MKNINSYIRIKLQFTDFFIMIQNPILGNFNFGWLCGRLFRQKNFSAKKEGQLNK